jgi:hypothetical protein
LLGAVVARAEAQTIRLALIYSLLDHANEIRHEHLRAAVALWEYCEASAEYVFGDLVGNAAADQISRALVEVAPKGMTRTDIRDLFKRHRGKDDIDSALATLAALGKAKSRDQITGGRKAEVWFAVKGK